MDIITYESAMSWSKCWFYFQPLFVTQRPLTSKYGQVSHGISSACVCAIEFSCWLTEQEVQPRSLWPPTQRDHSLTRLLLYNAGLRLFSIYHLSSHENDFSQLEKMLYIYITSSCIGWDLSHMTWVFLKATDSLLAQPLRQANCLP